MCVDVTSTFTFSPLAALTLPLPLPLPSTPFSLTPRLSHGLSSPSLSTNILLNLLYLSSLSLLLVPLLFYHFIIKSPTGLFPPACFSLSHICLRPPQPTPPLPPLHSPPFRFLPTPPLPSPPLPLPSPTPSTHYHSSGSWNSPGRLDYLVLLSPRPFYSLVSITSLLPPGPFVTSCGNIPSPPLSCLAPELLLLHNMVVFTIPYNPSHCPPHRLLVLLLLILHVHLCHSFPASVRPPPPPLLLLQLSLQSFYPPSTPWRLPSFLLNSVWVPLHS